MKLNANYGTHQPVLLKMIKLTKGPILELGAGEYSTRKIHALAGRRKVLTIDNSARWLNRYLKYHSPYHSLMLMDNDRMRSFYDADTTHWGLVFIDNDPWDVRVPAMRKYKDSADYVIIHDSDYYAIHNLFGKVVNGRRSFDNEFKYWAEFLPDNAKSASPPTLLGSNRFNLSGIAVDGMQIINRSNMNGIILHVIGDSHATANTWGGVSVDGMNILCHYLEGTTCASFGINRPDIKYLGVEKQDWACFCFGEIDCRNNVGRDKEHYKVVIDKIVENYFYAISQYEVSRVFIFNVPPAVIQRTAAGNPWPCCGTDEERMEYVRYMNARLKQECAICGFTFFDVHDKYADKDGYFNLQYRDNCVHIADPIFLIEFLTGVVNESVNSYSIL